MKCRFLNRLCALLCVLMIAGTFALPVSAACDHVFEKDQCTLCGQIGGTCGSNATWTFDPATGVLLIEGSGTMSTYSTATTAPWYPYRHEIKEAVMGGKVSSIGPYAFYDCSQMTGIYISKSVSNIYTSSFYKCDSLETFELEAGANYSLDSQGILYNKKQTYMIALPGGYSGVCEIPDSVVNVGPASENSNPFLYIQGITEFRASENNTTFYTDDNGLLYTKNVSRLIACPKSYTGNCLIPASVTKYESTAFNDCHGLTGIYVEEGNSSYSSTENGLLLFLPF